MARSSKVEYCMICEDTPCSCNARQNPRSKSRPQKQATAQEASARSGTAPREPRPAPSSFFTNEQLIEIAAVRILAPILHTDELTKYSGVLSSPPSVRERSLWWKIRRVDGLAGSTEIQG